MKVFSTGKTSKTIVFALGVVFFKKKFDIEKYCKGQGVHSADQSRLGTKSDSNYVKFLNVREHIWGRDIFS